MIIRDEEPRDANSIRELLTQAFGRADEADLVDELRRDGDLVFAGVAEIDGKIAGHAVFSKMSAPFPALGLGPVATLSAHRRAGAASALLRWGLERAAREGWRAVFVLGDPAFYRRFGFDTALADCFSSPYAGPHFMALALCGAPPSLEGAVDYARAFRRFETN